MDFNPYKVLAVDPSADADIIAAVYRQQSRKFHPDINKTPEAGERMRDINRAYDMLKDPEQRRKVDEQLARENSRAGGTTPFGTGAAPRPANPAGYTPPRPAPSRARGSGGLDWSNLGDQVRKRAEDVISNLRPEGPTDKTLYFYQKQLFDEAQRKNFKVSVYHDGATNRKVCNVRASAPNDRNVVTAGEVFLDSQGVFDLTLAFSEAARLLAEPTAPIEMNADHDVYFRQIVAGLGRTYIAVEVIKRTRSGTGSKEALLLIGEKNARTEKDGVISAQTPTQLQQIGRILKSALEAMR